MWRKWKKIYSREKYWREWANERAHGTNKQPEKTWQKKMQKIVIRVQWNSCLIAYQTKPDKQALTHWQLHNEKKTKFRQFSLWWKSFFSPRLASSFLQAWENDGNGMNQKHNKYTKKRWWGIGSKVRKLL